MAKKTVPSLKSMLSTAQLKEYGWNRSFERGEEYYRKGAVCSLIQHENRISAEVQGKRRYKANIHLSGSSLKYDCTCPAGGFCKHLIAAALAWNNGEADTLNDLDGDTPVSGRKKPASGTKKGKLNLRGHLLSMSKEELADIILEQAVDDKTLRERLRLSATVSNPGGMDLSAFRKRIDTALEPPDDFEYEGHYWDEEDFLGDEYARQLNPILDALRTMLKNGDAAAVLTLAKYALEELNIKCLAMEYESSGIDEMVESLAELHAKACALAKPDVESVAEWLFELGIKDADDSFGELPWEKYEIFLGKKGLTRFRSLAEAAWEAIPVRGGDSNDSNWRLRSRLEPIVMYFAKKDGSIDRQAAIIMKNLSSPHDYLELAQVYNSAKRHDEALAWAEKGWNGFPNGHHPELRDFLAAEYRRRKRNSDAIALYWEPFKEHPSLGGFQLLKKQTERDKIWPEWREKAFSEIRERITSSKKVAASRKKKGDATILGDYYHRDLDNSLLVEILLWEKKPQEAWDEAMSGGCREELWLKLSDWREKSHPEECVPIWKKRVARLTRDANQGDYAPAAESLDKLGKLMERIGERQTFAAMMRAMRDDLKRRRSFIKELDKCGLP